MTLCLIIDDELNFDQGRVVCPPQADGLPAGQAGMITIYDNVTVTDVSDSTYIEGPVKKIGNDAFTFPVGKQGHYRSIAISAPGATTDEFVAEYDNEDVSELYDTSSKDSTLVSISTNEYWVLSRENGTSDITVTLSWDEMSCGFDTLNNLRITAWNSSASGGKWIDLGNGSTTGDTASGTLGSNGNVSLYGYFALASKDTLDCVPCRADAGVDRIIYAGWTTRVGVDSVAQMNYLWTPAYALSDPTLANPLSNPEYELDYTIETTNDNGCVASDQVNVEVRIPIRMNHRCIVH